MKQESPYDLLHYYIRHWRVVVNITLLFFILGAIYVFAIQKAQYKSTATVAVVQQKDASDARTIANYAALLESRSVLEEPAQKNGVSVGSLNDTIAVKYKSGTDMIYATTTASSAAAARGYLTDSLKTLQDRAKAIYGSGEIKIVDAPSLAAKPFNVNATMQLAVMTAAGLVLAVVGLFFRYDYATVAALESSDASAAKPVIAPPKRTVGNAGEATVDAANSQHRAIRIGSAVRSLLVGRSE